MVNALDREADLLPLQVRLLPEGVFVEEELKGFRSIPVGSRVVAINGKSIESIMERLLATVVCDGANRTYAERVVEREFNVRYNLYVEQASTYKIEFVGPDKLPGERTVFAMTGEQIFSTRKPKGTGLLPWGSTAYPDHDVLWVNMRTLDADSLGLAPIMVTTRPIWCVMSQAGTTVAGTWLAGTRSSG